VPIFDADFANGPEEFVCVVVVCTKPFQEEYDKHMYKSSLSSSRGQIIIYINTARVDVRCGVCVCV